MDVVELLERARKRIERPECWTKGEDARDANGAFASPDEEGAVCWCMNGALYAESQNFYSREAGYRALRQAIGTFLTEFNDAPERTHAEVLSAYDRAIAIAKSEQSNA